MKSTWIAGAAALLLAGAALAAPSETDRSFVAEAAAAGAAEVAMGRVASSKAGAATVRDFGKRMVEDHSKAGAELKTLAEAQGVRVTDAPNAEQKATLQKLEQLSGNAFDAEYIRIQREDHDKAVALFRKQADTGSDPSLKQFAATTLPTLEAHRKMAHELPAAGKHK